MERYRLCLKGRERIEFVAKIKIALIVEAIRDGVRQHICDIVKNLDREKYQIYLIYSEVAADPIFIREKDSLSHFAQLIRCDSMVRELGFHDFIAFMDLKKIIRNINPDIVHCHSSKAGIVGRMAAKNIGIRGIVYTPHAYAFQNVKANGVKRRIYIEAEKILARFATTMTINVSRGEMYEALKNKIDQPKKFTVIYNAVSDRNVLSKEEAREKLGLKKKMKYVGVTARCSQQKNPFEFLSIAETVVTHKEGIEFIYIGDGDYFCEMKKWIQKRDLGDKIHMLGYRSDASEIVGALDIFLSTALFEGLPYSMVEAMRAGVPVIASDVVGNNEVVHNGENGWLYTIGDIEAARKLILNQIEDMKITSKSVLSIFNEEFTLDRMISSLDDVYKTILEDV